MDANMSQLDLTTSANGLISYSVGDGTNIGDVRTVMGLSDGLPQEIKQRALLDVADITNQIWRTLSVLDPDTFLLEGLVKAGLNSFQLGDQHKVSSGGDMVWNHNLNSNINWGNLATGVKDQSQAANQDETGIIPPTARIYGDTLLTSVPFAGVHASANVAYDVSLTGSNTSSYGVRTFLGEALATGDILTYMIRLGDENGITLYSQRIIVQANMAAGDPLIWWFEHPFDGNPNDTYQVLIFKGRYDTGAKLLCRQSTADAAQMYRDVFYRPFTDELVRLGPETSDIFTPVSNIPWIIEVNTSYTVTTAGIISLVCPANDIAPIGSWFRIRDERNLFNATNGVLITFPGGQTARLVARGDDFTFYRAQAGYWLYINNSTGFGDTV
ncbi:MAG: hypothetical protein JKY54_06060 [Flavobacteriales bacterium]|nr:hypothetical protein [Flavobacteriales bacterium]